MISYGSCIKPQFTAFSLTLPLYCLPDLAICMLALKEKEARAVFAYILKKLYLLCAGTCIWLFPCQSSYFRGLDAHGLFDYPIDGTKLFNLLMAHHLPLGVLFELPVLVVFLTSIGLLTPQFLITYRRYAYFVLLVLAVVLTL